MVLHGIAARGFALQTQNYELVRPGYSDSVLSFALKAAQLGDGQGKRVLDLAAGTGKLTRCLAARLPQAHLVAAEPVAAMREQFTQVLGPAVPIVGATAASLPFDSGSLDAVFVGQAFHWFCNEDSLRELHRVLRPGGCLCLVWNLEDDTEPLVAALRAVYEKHDMGIPQYRKGAWKQVFRDPWAAQAFERLDVLPTDGQGLPGSIAADDPAAQVVSSTYFHDRGTWSTPQQIWQRVLSKSYVAVLTPPQQQELRGQVLAVIAQHSAAFEAAPNAASAAGAGLQTAPAAAAGGATKEVMAAAELGGVDPAHVACIPIRTEVVLCRRRP